MQMHPEHSPDESVKTAEHGITQVVRNFFGGGSRAQDTVLAIAIVVIILQAVLLYGAWKDLNTRIWLRSDSLTKENSALLGHYIALEDLVQSYGIAKTLRSDKQEKHP